MQPSWMGLGSANDLGTAWTDFLFPRGLNVLYAVSILLGMRCLADGEVSTAFSAIGRDEGATSNEGVPLGSHRESWRLEG
jgi:hypothetical protein